ncbi:MAG: GGDEF domain-containing protein, partial [Acholeplasmatales bacterium]|nr:GGDEF domain-containing protein [Acholeplasmatales bacterium]
LNTKNFTPANKWFRYLLFSTMIFLISDFMWGILDHLHIIPILYADTVIFYIAMSLTVICWTRYAILYSNRNGLLDKIFLVGGLIIFITIVILTIINFFYPVLYKFDGNVYVALLGLLIILILQQVLFLIVGLAAIILAIRSNTKRNKFLAIASFSLTMFAATLLQSLFPLLPFYSLGTTIGISFIHSFIVMAEKDKYRKSLEDILERELKQKEELDVANTKINIDSLTGANSKYSYIEMEERIDKLIAQKQIEKFSVVVFDINGLKKINDTKGHDFGDIYIKDCYNLMKECFSNEQIYRFGGDEFVTILENDDYDNRIELVNIFNDKVNANLNTELPIVALGISDFELGVDNTYRAVFTRADEKMYIRKKFLKAAEIKK